MEPTGHLLSQPDSSLLGRIHARFEGDIILILFHHTPTNS